VSLDHVQIKLYVLDPYVRSLLFIAGMLLSSDRPALVPVIWENKVVGLRYGTDPAKTSISVEPSGQLQEDCIEFGL
jgi:hypothetical protein